MEENIMEQSLGEGEAATSLSAMAGNEDIVGLYKSIFAIEKKDICSYSPLSLAFIGDGVYDLIIRTLIISEGNKQVNKMHKDASALVKAATQARMIEFLENQLTKEELSAYKRGRNAKSFTSAKNASMIDYRKATGFEALIGYLYLTKQFERLFTLVKAGLTEIGDK